MIWQFDSVSCGLIVPNFACGAVGPNVGFFVGITEGPCPSHHLGPDIMPLKWR